MPHVSPHLRVHRIPLAWGCSSKFGRSPPLGFDIAHDCLTALVNVNVLYGDLLLPFASMAIERVEEHCEGAREN